MNSELPDFRTQLEERINHPSVPKPRSLWRHYKGDVYKVDNIGIRESTKELEVCYHAVDKSLAWFWIRPVSEWNQLVIRDGIEVARFSLVMR